MSAGFKAVQWNRAKIIYDLVMVACVAAFIGGFIALKYASAAPGKPPNWEDVRIEVFGACAFLMISFILMIGPLARISPKFLPLLYNRRHFGVLACIIAAIHGYFVYDWFAMGNSQHNLWRELISINSYNKFIGFSIKPIGIFALLIFLTMAATSHDYWLKVLTPPVWKAIHMAIYIAYGMLVMHVALGVMQGRHALYIPITLALISGSVAGVHLYAAFMTREPETMADPDNDQWLVVGPPALIPDQRARIIAAPGGERIAVFRDGNRVSAVTNVCAHQNGPLGEGKIVNGCIVCPWHGWEYRMEDGRAPPPFTEKIATYRLRLREGAIEVDPRPLAPGTSAALILT